MGVNLKRLKKQQRALDAKMAACLKDAQDKVYATWRKLGVSPKQARAEANRVTIDSDCKVTPKKKARKRSGTTKKSAKKKAAKKKAAKKKAAKKKSKRK